MFNILRKSANKEELAKRKIMLLSFTSIVIVLLPIAQNFTYEPTDDFPLSFYPMFTKSRPAIQKQSHVLAVKEDGTIMYVPSMYIASGGQNQARRQLSKKIRGSKKGLQKFADSIAKRIEKSSNDEVDGIQEIQIVIGSFDVDSFFLEKQKDPIAIKIRATSKVKK